MRRSFAEAKDDEQAGARTTPVILRRSRRISQCFFLLLLCSPAFALAQVSLQLDCDIIGVGLEESSQNSAELCQQKCSANPLCQGFTFISHWNKCFLKKDAKRVVPVKMHSGLIQNVADKREIQSQGERMDNKGKDWRKETFTSPEPCKELCLREAPCQGYTFIAGHNTCWLKNTSGKLVEKIFTCGKRL